MKTYITDKEVRDFLQDFEENSQTLILEEGKEKDEILEIASARGIQLKNSKDLAGFKTIYTFADEANKNRARLPKQKLLKALPGIVGKPVDIDHNRRYVVGHYIDYRYIVKDEMVVAYGVFYKSNFAEEWDNAQKLFKSGKLATSYEIWCPKNKRNKLADGTVELLEEEIAGGALLFKTKPAFEDAKVLELAKTNIDQLEHEMVYASEYRCEDLIINGEPSCNHCGKCKHIEEEPVNAEVVATVPAIETIKVEDKKPEIVKIKCANCQHEFDKPFVPVSEIKCSECFAIINDRGEILYPPQIIDFSVSCPLCSSRNWRLLQKEEMKGKVKCLSCAKSFNIEFEHTRKDENLDKLQFLHIGRISCKQCGYGIAYSGTSHNKTYNLKCSHCGLQFAHDITHDQIKKLTKIEEVIAQSSEPIKASQEIASQADELKTDNSAINPEVAKGEPEMTVEGKKEEVIEPTPVVAQEQPVPVTPTVEATPQAKPEEAVQPVTPSVEAIVETPKVETPVEAKVEAPIEVKVEVPIEAKTEEKKENKLEKYSKGIRKLAKKVKDMKKEKASIVKAMEEKVEFYKANAEEITKRRKELGDFGTTLNDTDILDAKKYSDAKLEKANKELETSSVAGTKKQDADETAKTREIIRQKSEGLLKREH